MLSSISKGNTVIVAIDPPACPDGRVLAAMGVRAGRRVRVCRPGRTVVVDLLSEGGAAVRLGLDRRLAALVAVRPDHAAAD